MKVYHGIEIYDFENGVVSVIFFDENETFISINLSPINEWKRIICCKRK